QVRRHLPRVRLSLAARIEIKFSTGVSMSQIIAILVIFSFSCGAPAFAQTDLSALAAAARQEKEVVWYTTTSAGDNQAIVAGFNKKYPFLKVQVLRSTGEKLR